MRYSTFQDIRKLPDQIWADLGTPLIQGLLDTISKLLAVRGRALLPQAPPVEQVPRLQVQGAGPRQERPGRAAVGAHGSSGPAPDAAGWAGRRAGGLAGLNEAPQAGEGGPPTPQRAAGRPRGASSAPPARGAALACAGSRRRAETRKGQAGRGGERRLAAAGAVSWKTMTKQKSRSESAS